MVLSTRLTLAHYCTYLCTARSPLTFRVKIFRPDENAKRIQASASRILMEAPPEELFVKACKMCVKVPDLDPIPIVGWIVMRCRYCRKKCSLYKIEYIYSYTYIYCLVTQIIGKSLWGGRFLIDPVFTSIGWIAGVAHCWCFLS